MSRIDLFGITLKRVKLFFRQAEMCCEWWFRTLLNISRQGCKFLNLFFPFFQRRGVREIRVRD